MACFIVQTQGIGAGCAPSGNYTTRIDNVNTVTFENRIVPSNMPFAGCPYRYLVVDGVSRFPDFTGGSAGGTGTIIEIDCATGQPLPKYDCINGTCVLKNVYNTPGIYESLEECEAACGNQPMCSAPFECIDPSNFCPHGKVCIPQSEWNQIEGLSNQLKQRNCS